MLLYATATPYSILNKQIEQKQTFIFYASLEFEFK